MYAELYQYVFYLRHTSSCMCVGFVTRPTYGLALKGRRKRRSNQLDADLSLTPVTYWCKLLGTRCVAAYLQLELFRRYSVILQAIFLYVAFVMRKSRVSERWALLYASKQVGVFLYLFKSTDA
ncbi:hypothetical protein C9I36_16945 [Pectobacterium punjabense]|nr:hypothetical protein C9I36_16945 [Pectobacterium punjabense]